MIDVQHGNVLDWAATYDGEPFHALLCDPPYEIGFMGRRWDNTGIAFRPETWAALAQHLHPGAWGMAFASSRGWHRMACAIEDAGLIIHPTIFCWVYGSGFPKATNPGPQIDRRLGAERRVVGTRKHAPKFNVKAHGGGKNTGYNSRERETFEATTAGSETAAAWEGHRYGGQALKPAVEPIIVFQKPYSQAPVDDMLATGAGALWIDGGRIDTGERWARNNKPGQNGAFNASGGPVESGAGRWPANFVPQHLPACNGSCAPGCPVERLGAMSGVSVSAGGVTSRASHFAHTHDDLRMTGNRGGLGDTGTAARFFLNPGWMLERLELADPIGYYAKASQAEREAGLDPVQVRLMQDLYGDDLIEFAEETINDGRKTPIDNAYQRGETERRNTHPTIKSLELTRWLASLLLPPAPYAPRRLLNPFGGVASEALGGDFAGWEHVTCIELEAQHVAIAQARIRYWQGLRHRFLAGQPIEVKVNPKAERPPMFDLLDQM